LYRRLSFLPALVCPVMYGQPEDVQHVKLNRNLTAMDEQVRAAQNAATANSTQTPLLDQGEAR
jgi:hypothetical protein